MKDNTPIVILLVLFVLLGLAYSPFKEAQKNKPRITNSQTSSSAIGDTSADYSTNKNVAEGVKNAEESIKRLEENINKQIEESRRSPYYGKVMMSNISGVYNQDPSKEYVTLSTSLDNAEILNVTGWYLKSEVTGYYAVIGKAALLPFPFTRTESNVVLARGDRVILTKGFSPIGISFRANKCTGYFEENRAFTPRLSLKCPLPQDEKLPTFSSIYDRNDECLDIIESIPRCTTVNNSFVRNLPDTVSTSCKNYITTQINYNSCVTLHFGDTDFPGNEYRIFLNRFGPLWREKREKLNLHDQNGLIVDSISY